MVHLPQTIIVFGKNIIDIIFMHCLFFMYLLAPFIFQWFFLRLSLLEGIFKSMSPQILRDRFIWRSPKERGQCGTRGTLGGWHHVMGNAWGCWYTLKLTTTKKLNFWGFFSIVDPDAHVIFGSKMSHLLQTRIFWESHLQTFDLPHDPSRCAAFKKILMAGTEI